jgi:Stress responsive A/B Barrel Domain
VIQHIVLLKWKPGTTDEQINDAFGRAQELVDRIESVERITLGRNRGEMDHGFTHALIVKLSDDDALSSYLRDPVRERYIKEALAPIEQERIEIDVPEDAHIERKTSRRHGWDWGDAPRTSASAAAAALRWEETHPEP